MKGRLYGMVGSKGGLDMARADKDAVVEFLRQFSGKGRPDPEDMPLTGTSWKLLFTESESASRGLRVRSEQLMREVCA